MIPPRFRVLSARVVLAVLVLSFVLLMEAARAEEPSEMAPDPAGVSREFVWTSAPFPSAHASTIVEAADGTLVAAWFGGSDEGEPDVGIWTARKVPGAGAKWTAPALVFKEPNQPAWNPVLWRTAEGAVRLDFKIGPSPREWSAGWTVSTDSGATWAEPKWHPSGLLGPIRCKPIRLADGAVLAGTSFESYRTWASWMERSEDGGATWTKHGPIAFLDEAANRQGTIQPTLLEVAPGHVRALFRTRGLGKISRAESKDGGRTWGPMELTDMDHPGAGIDAVRLTDGRCVMIYNPARTGRNPLSLAVSKDGGLSWERWIDVDRLIEGERGELSYPAIIQGADGDLHATWTWKRERVRYARVSLSAIPR